MKQGFEQMIVLTDAPNVDDHAAFTRHALGVAF